MLPSSSPGLITHLCPPQCCSNISKAQLPCDRVVDGVHPERGAAQAHALIDVKLKTDTPHRPVKHQDC
eukprot:5855881-Amphidinium_carterae.1